jgi:hypothetical protein
MAIVTPWRMSIGRRPLPTSKVTVIALSNPGAMVFLPHRPNSTLLDPLRSALWCQPGSLFIIPPVRPWPFDIGKVLTAEHDGTITFQWYSTIGFQTNSTYLPSWWDGVAKYDAPEPNDISHVPFTDVHEQILLTQRDLIFHSFVLTDRGYLLPQIREECSLHPLIWWYMRVQAPLPPEDIFKERKFPIPNSAPSPKRPQIDDYKRRSVREKRTKTWHGE